MDFWKKRNAIKDMAKGMVNQLINGFDVEKTWETARDNCLREHLNFKTLQTCYKKELSSQFERIISRVVWDVKNDYLSSANELLGKFSATLPDGYIFKVIKNP